MKHAELKRIAEEGMEQACANILKLFGPDTYCINIPHSIAREELVSRGQLEWVPAPAWSGPSTYALTDAGREARALLSGASDE